MNIRALIIATISQIFLVHTTTTFSYLDQNLLPDYYWRDYLGIIPADAIEGGTDEVGNPTYIGQAYIKDFELLPAIITRGCKTVSTTAYGKEVTTDTNVKILCAKDKKKLEWVPTNSEETHLMTNRHFVVGGTELGHTITIGRVNHDGKLVVGRILSYPLPNRGLAIPYQGKPLVFQSYEILTYNIIKKAHVKPLEIDVDVRFQ